MLQDVDERRYRNRRIIQILPMVRACFLLGIGFNFLFLILDRRAGVDMATALCLRSIWSAAMAAAILISLFRRTRLLLPWLVWFAGGCVGSWLLSVMMAITPVGGDRHLTGLMMLYLSIAAMAPGRRAALWTIVSLTLIPNIVMVYFHFPSQRMIEADAFLGMAAILSAAISFLLDSSYRKAFELEWELKRRATTDALTGLANRHLFRDEAAREVARMRRDGTSLSLVLADIDHFKAINDRWGHDAGDRVLCAVAARLAGCVRAPDVVARLGGEEFVALAPGTGLAEAAVLAERIRRKIGQLDLVEGGAPVAVTVSVGCATVRADEATVDDALKRADDALYAAKAGGRNQVRLEGGAEIPSVPDRAATDISATM